MATNLHFDGTANKYAVYIDGAGTAPLTDPLNNLSFVKWHASLPYLGATKVSLTWNFTSGAVYTHGLSYRPLVIGVAWIGGNPVPMLGMFTVKRGPSGYGYMYGLSSDATSIRIDEYDTSEGFYSNVTLALTDTITVDLYICNTGLDSSGAVVNPPTFNGIEATPTRFRAGQFDTNNKYFSADAAGTEIFYQADSIKIDVFNYLGITQHVGSHWASNAVSTTPAYTPTIIKTKAS